MTLKFIVYYTIIVLVSSLRINISEIQESSRQQLVAIVNLVVKFIMQFSYINQNISLTHKM